MSRVLKITVRSVVYRIKFAYLQQYDLWVHVFQQVIGSLSR
jgi:hypothetical protein